MRLIPDDADRYQAGRTYLDITECFAVKDTIEITDEEWDEIYWDFHDYFDAHPEFDEDPTFSQYLRELLELKK